MIRTLAALALISRLSMDHQQQLAVLRLTQGDPAFLALAVFFIRNGNHQGVMKHRGGLFETYPMLAPVVGSLGWIPFKVKLIHRLLTGGRLEAVGVVLEDQVFRQPLSGFRLRRY